MSDQWDFWKRSLAGEMLPIHADQPQSGFYRMRKHKGGPWIPVAIWRKGDELIALKETRDNRVDAHDIWTYCAPNAVTKDDAAAAFDGRGWPGDVEAPAGIGDNSGDLSLLEELADYQARAEAWMKETKTVADQVTADKAANYAAQLADLKNKAEKERKKLVEPHVAAQKEINGKYNPKIKEAEGVVAKLKRAQEGWLLAEKKRLEEEARAKYAAELKAAEEERKRQEAERAKLMRDDPIAAITEPEPEAVAPPPPPEPVRVSAGGQAGRKVSLRKVTVYEIGNWADVWAWAREDGEAAEAIEKLALKRARAGEDVPGVIKTTEERAA